MSIPYVIFGAFVASAVIAIIVIIREQLQRVPVSRRSSSLSRQENSSCIICYEAECEVTLEPCNHSPMCSGCWDLYKNYDRRCPMCRADVSHVVKK